MLLKRLYDTKQITPPKWLIDNTMYLTIMGSNAYAVTSDNSDWDIYGFCIPPKEDIFPHLKGEILGFGNQTQRFEQWQEHHVQPIDKKQMFDFTVYSIVKYFQLCMENNPNMIDSLFTPRNCVIHTTRVGEHVRDNRKIFLHKGAWHKFKGYAYAQMSKIQNKNNSSNPKRSESIEKYGYDVKFAYHVVRLLNEVEQIMVEHDLDLTRNNEQLKSIRRGDWTLEQLKQYFTEKERVLEKIYGESTLRHKPDEKAIKNILIECLEIHYGSVDNFLNIRNDNTRSMIRDIEEILNQYKYKK